MHLYYSVVDKEQLIPSIAIEVISLLCFLESPNILQQASYQYAGAGIPLWTVYYCQVLVVQIVPTLHTFTQTENALQYRSLCVFAR